MPSEMTKSARVDGLWRALFEIDTEMYLFECYMAALDTIYEALHRNEQPAETYANAIFGVNIGLNGIFNEIRKQLDKGLETQREREAQK